MTATGSPTIAFARLPPGAREELLMRGLSAPRWTSGGYVFGPEDAASLHYLVENHELALDATGRATLRAWEAEARMETAQQRMARLEAALRPYQTEGVAFMQARERVMLADSMGLGKTLQALVAVEKSARLPCIILCPAAVKLGWEREILKWMPWRSAQVLRHGKDAPRGAQFTILNPELMPAHMEALMDLKAKALILDEAHFFKNPDSLRSQNAMRLAQGVPMRLALSGTPIKNRREDLEHQLRILGQLENVLGIYRGILPHWWKPEKGPLASTHAVTALQRLDRQTLHSRLLETCMFRRTKKDVAPDLPSLTRTRVELAPTHLEKYKVKEQAMLDWVRKWQAKYGAEAARMHAGIPLEFRGHLTQLRREAALAKVAHVRDWVEPLMESGERVVFFAFHKNVVEALRQALPGKVAIITGDTPPASRRAILDAMDHVDFLVATMDSTGYGVDGIQVHASHVAFVELDWTPTKHEQCEGRLHRIGQTQPVNAWYLVATNTFDATMMDVLEAKWGDIQGVVDGQAEDAFLGDLLDHLGQPGKLPWQTPHAVTPGAST